MSTPVSPFFKALTALATSRSASMSSPESISSRIAMSACEGQGKRGGRGTMRSRGGGERACGHAGCMHGGNCIPASAHRCRVGRFPPPIPPPGPSRALGLCLLGACAMPPTTTPHDAAAAASTTQHPPLRTPGGWEVCQQQYAQPHCAVVLAMARSGGVCKCIHTQRRCGTAPYACCRPGTCVCTYVQKHTSHAWQYA